ncbi:hypothetical protein Tcan_15860 [Toxocara canis]|uniref:Uncharacterized protein n=1 Tax=Toxocara canis TaxID=6265 RepID=A0A0B2UYX5_TOXCA|nr:hypothetical protein Tcan_15860 [Toxocara canis]
MLPYQPLWKPDTTLSSNANNTSQRSRMPPHLSMGPTKTLRQSKWTPATLRTVPVPCLTQKGNSDGVLLYSLVSRKPAAPLVAEILDELNVDGVLVESYGMGVQPSKTSSNQVRNAKCPKPYVFPFDSVCPFIR